MPLLSQMVTSWDRWDVKRKYVPAILNIIENICAFYCGLERNITQFVPTLSTYLLPIYISKASAAPIQLMLIYNLPKKSA